MASLTFVSQRSDAPRWYLARGRYAGRQFGKTLIGDPTQAAGELRRLLVAIEMGTFEIPSEARRRPLKTGQAPLINIRELCDRFLTEKRRLLGKKTASAYQFRLVPLIEFAEQPAARRRWPLARDLDRDFAVEFCTWLNSRVVTRNGHPASEGRRISPRQIHNVLDCGRSMFHWGRRPDVNLLPSSFPNPFTKEIVGERAKKDPLRRIPIPMDHRMKLLVAMDRWQLCQFALSLVLPLPPEDVTGLLVNEVAFDQNLVLFGTRLAGRDFNKGRQTFVTPVPQAIATLLRACVGGRIDGPLLRRRAVWEGHCQLALTVASPTDVAARFDQAFQAASKDDIQAVQDGKRLFRRVLLRMGGVSGDEVAREFKTLLAQVGLSSGVRFYDLRAATTTELERSGVSHLVQRYVTGHSTDDILFEYASLDPVNEMKKYFEYIRPLLMAIEQRAGELGLVD